MYQATKKAIQRRVKGVNVQRSNFYVRNEKAFKTLYSCVLMPAEKFKDLMKLRDNYEQREKKFILPGFLTANKTKEHCFENFLSPFGNHGNFVKVLFKINVDLSTDGNQTRTTFMNLCKTGANYLTTGVDLSNE